jgi:hypothetical protein
MIVAQAYIVGKVERCAEVSIRRWMSKILIFVLCMRTKYLRISRRCQDNAKMPKHSFKKAWPRNPLKHNYTTHSTYFNIYTFKVRSLFCYRRSVGKFILVRASLWGPCSDFKVSFVWQLLVSSLGHSLWREDGSVICRANIYWSESRRTHNHTSMSHPRLPHLSQSQSYITTDGQSAILSWCRVLLWTQDQISFLFFSLVSDNCLNIEVGRPVWREDGSVLPSAVTHWSELRITHNHTLLPHLILTFVKLS